MFSAHLDRVEGGDRGKAASGSTAGFTSDGSTILGADNAAGLAAIIEACRVLRRREAHAPLELVLTVGEEIGLVGAAQVDMEALRSKVGFVLDAEGPWAPSSRGRPRST